MANNDDGKKKRKKGKKTYVRAERNIGITLESGWNSLSGAGINGTYYVNPNVAVDIGAGFGLQVLKGGLRGRYLFSKKNFTPYVGGGLLLAPLSLDATADDDFDVIGIKIKSSVYGQLVGGFEFMSNGGFLIGLNIGYAILLNDNIEVTNGELTSDEEAALKLLYGSGVAIGFNIGYAF